MSEFMSYEQSIDEEKRKIAQLTDQQLMLRVLLILLRDCIQKPLWHSYDVIAVAEVLQDRINTGGGA